MAVDRPRDWTKISRGKAPEYIWKMEKDNNMNFINKIVCLIKKHDWMDIGSCPYTNNSYIACKRCKVTSKK